MTNSSMQAIHILSFALLAIFLNYLALDSVKLYHLLGYHYTSSCKLSDLCYHSLTNYHDTITTSQAPDETTGLNGVVI